MISRVQKFYAFLTRHRLWLADWNGANLRAPPLTHLHLIFFTGFLCQTLSPRGFMMTTYGSVCAYLSAVRAWARANNRPDPAIDPDTNLPHIRYLRFCKATKRRLGGKALTRKPLSPESLRAMLRLARIGAVVHGPVVLDLVAALLLAFFALLRVSEYTTPTKGAWFDTETHATRGDIQFVPSYDNCQHIVFTVKVSKNDQHRIGHELVIYPSTDPSFCPIAALKRLFSADPQPPSAPLFDFTRRATNQPARTRSMDRPAYIALFNATVVAAGLPVSATKTHSLRSGGASAMLRAGVATYVISKLGRWKSHCWERYVWASHFLIQQAHSRIGSALPLGATVDLDAVRR